MYSVVQRGDGTVDHGLVNMLRTHVAEAAAASEHDRIPLVVTVPAIVAALRRSPSADLGFGVLGYDELSEGDTVEQLGEIRLPLPSTPPPASPTEPPIHVDRKDMGEAADWKW